MTRRKTATASSVEAHPSSAPPKLKSDFQRNGTPAKWAKGFPRKWGSEIKHLSFPQEEIESVSKSEDEKLLAVAAGRDIYICRIDTFEIVEKLDGHTQRVGHVEFQPGHRHRDGYILASDAASTYGMDPLVILWSLDQHGRAHENGHSLDLQAVSKAGVDAAFNSITSSAPEHSWSRAEPAVSHLSTAFSAALEDASRMHKFAHQVSIPNAAIPGFGSSAFSPDGTTLLFTSTVNEGYVGPRERITAWDIAANKEMFHMEGHMDSIMWTGFSPNGKLIASSSWDSMLKVYSAEDGKLLRDYGKTGGRNWAAAFSPCSRFIAVGCGGMSPGVFIWEVDDPQSFPIKLDGFPGWVRSLSWSPDSELLAAGSMNGKLVVFNPHTRTVEQTWEIDMKQSGLSDVEIGDVKWLSSSRKAKLLAFNPGNAALLVYAFDTNTKFYVGPRDEDPWNAGYWCDNIVPVYGKKWVGNVDQDRQMRFWDLSTMLSHT